MTLSNESDAERRARAQRNFERALVYMGVAFGLLAIAVAVLVAALVVKLVRG